MHLPLSEPVRGPNETDYVLTSLSSGATGGNGPFNRAVQDILRRRHDDAHVLTTTSCTSALELAAMTLELGPGDEVIVPSFTHPSTANAFARTGATVVLVDIESDTLGLDPAAVEEAITTRTRAIVPVHYAGNACQIELLVELADDRGIAVVEDNAHSLFGRAPSGILGTLGRFSAASFHVTKSFSSGEGGALVVNRPTDVSAVETRFNMGTDRAAWERGDIDAYSWQTLGSSFALADLPAASLLAQLEQIDSVIDARGTIVEHYDRRLRDQAADLGLTLPRPRPGAVTAGHFFWVLVDEPEGRDPLIRALNGAGIGAASHFVPLHRSAGGRTIARLTPCDTTTSVAGRIVRLPVTATMTADDVELVVTALDAARS